MHVELAGQAGFCFGVKNTIQKIEDTLRSAHEPVWSIGLPVHNKQLTERLQQKGLRIADAVDEVTEGILIVRAHGLPPAEIESLHVRGITIIDGTCPFVKKAQNTAHELSSEGYFILLCGEEKHPEVRAIAGCISGPYRICTSADDVRSFKSDKKVALISQTTQSPVIFNEIAGVLSTRQLPELKVVDTICKSVHNRKEAAMTLAAHVDIMFVVGGKMSSNTKRLYEVSLQENPRSYHIETAAEIDPAWFAAARTAGVTAGASTPDWIISEVVRFCESI